MLGAKRKAPKAPVQKESVRRGFEKMFRVESATREALAEEGIEAGAAQGGVQEGRAGGAPKGARQQREPPKGRKHNERQKQQRQQTNGRKSEVSDQAPTPLADLDRSVLESLAGLAPTSSLKTEEGGGGKAGEGTETEAEEEAETKAEEDEKGAETPPATGAGGGGEGDGDVSDDGGTKMETKAEEGAGTKAPTGADPKAAEGAAEGAKSDEIVGEVLFPVVPTEPKCNRCRQPLDPLRAQITGKSGGSWRCSLCNSRAVQVTRLPSWAQLRQHLKDIPAEEAALFWSNAHSAVGKAALENCVSGPWSPGGHSQRVQRSRAATCR